MRRLFLLSGVATLLLLAPAFAADMPTKAYNAAPPVEYMFAGFYVGAHGGWTTLDADPFKVSADGFVYGGHAGFNFQKGPIVAGIEGAITQYNNATKFAGSSTGCECLVADLLAKVGFTPATNVLVYAVGGGFWHDAAVPANLVPAFGWAAGAGVDWMPLGNHVVLGARYLYRSLGNDNSFAQVIGHELTARLSWKF